MDPFIFENVKMLAAPLFCPKLVLHLKVRFFYEHFDKCFGMEFIIFY